MSCFQLVVVITNKTFVVSTSYNTKGCATGIIGYNINREGAAGSSSEAEIQKIIQISIKYFNYLFYIKINVT